jgi:hypothetical protein
MSLFLIAQFVGVIAVVISLTIFQLNKRQTMLKFGMTAAFLYSLHFFLLGAPTGAAMNLIGALRSFVYFRTKPSRKNIWIPLVFLTIASIATLLTWQGPVSLLALAGSVLGGIAFWQKNPKLMRHIAILVPPLWFTYNAMVGSYPGMFIEVAMLISILVGRYRLDIGHKHHLRRHLARPA